MDNPVYASDNWTSIDPQQSFEEECNCIPVGVSEKSFEGQLSVYPNPTIGFVTLTFGTSSTGIVNLINQQGKVVFSEQVNNAYSMNFEIQESAGIYFMEFIDVEGEMQLVKVLKVN